MRTVSKAIYLFCTFDNSQSVAFSNRKKNENQQRRKTLVNSLCILMSNERVVEGQHQGYKPQQNAHAYKNERAQAREEKSGNIVGRL